MLAGISSDYYLRLEHGRDTHPPAQVLDTLARALQLDVKASEYLHQLASPSSRGRDPAGIDAADGVDELIDQFPMQAIVASRCLDVLAAKSLARELSPRFTPRAKTSCAGGYWIPPLASCTWIGMGRRTSRLVGWVKRPGAIPMISAHCR
jgi:transcriptional regulator with XRE-family HTH domain